MLGLCLGMAGVVWTRLPLEHFSLQWQHSVEKIRWEEDYRLESQGLRLVEARVRGTGAGMEIPDDAWYADGSWHYVPALAPIPVLSLGRSPQVADWQLCRDGECHELSHWLGPPQAEVELWPCTAN
ncbi:DUF1850 domain-containing protein [Shewanella sedimentimangrovi]|uniref:DUF1850 domain-containing protein n=1 Tax=Shewanella sedimentimangrovi TaxID=2814293 RepID=A0ABX7R3H2_9GAMM|nr:DUF1850 domain-containing protein [Shewanella sedimentimangrovi]QSX37341.1 DUF1850 domain-containing protein [Shewanella sedimentimangrovi]